MEGGLSKDVLRIYVRPSFQEGLRDFKMGQGDGNVQGGGLGLITGRLLGADDQPKWGRGFETLSAQLTSTPFSMR